MVGRKFCPMKKRGAARKKSDLATRRQLILGLLKQEGPSDSEALSAQLGISSLDFTHTRSMSLQPMLPGLPAASASASSLRSMAPKAITFFGLTCRKMFGMLALLGRVVCCIPS